MHSYYQIQHPYQPSFQGSITPIYTGLTDGRFNPSNEPTVIDSVVGTTINFTTPKTYRRFFTPQGQLIIIDDDTIHQPTREGNNHIYVENATGAAQGEDVKRFYLDPLVFPSSSSSSSS